MLSAIIAFYGSQNPKERATYHVAYVDSKGFASASVTTDMVIDHTGLLTIKSELQRQSKNPDTSSFVILNIIKLPVQ